MKKTITLFFVLFAFGAGVVNAQTSTFTYQGRLTDGGAPANGPYQMQFSLFPSEVGGDPLGPPIQMDSVDVRNGVFTVELNFTTPSAFNGGARWLGIAVKKSTDHLFSLLTPRQPFTSTPYAIKSLSADIANDSTHLGAKAASDYVLTTDSRMNDARTPTAGSGDYIQNSNTSSQPQSSSFNILGSGSMSGGLSVGGSVNIDGSVRIGIVSPSNLDVKGTVRVQTLLSGPSETVCADINHTLSHCSSSIRYKENINSFAGGFDLISRLRPVAYTWKQNGAPDMGLVAEEVADVEPLLVTHNDKGEIEGVKYDRVGVVLINAVKEQQAQIEDQRTLIQSQQKSLETQQRQIEKQQKQVDALKRLVCSMNASADICKKEQ